MSERKRHHHVFALRVFEAWFLHLTFDWGGIVPVL